MVRVRLNWLGSTMEERNIHGRRRNEARPSGCGRINMSEDHEIRYWTEKFGCTKEQLVSAVGSVGPSAVKVEAYLKRK